MKLKVLVDTSYYKYTGEDEKISMKMNDTLRGILLIDNAPKEVSIAFSASEGYSVNLTTVGENIILYKLTDGDKELGSSKTNLDTMLVPNDSVRTTILPHATAVLSKRPPIPASIETTSTPCSA